MLGFRRQGRAAPQHELGQFPGDRRINFCKVYFKVYLFSHIEGIMLLEIIMLCLCLMTVAVSS